MSIFKDIKRKLDGLIDRKVRQIVRNFFANGKLKTCDLNDSSIFPDFEGDLHVRLNLLQHGLTAFRYHLLQRLINIGIFLGGCFVLLMIPIVLVVVNG